MLQEGDDAGDDFDVDMVEEDEDSGLVREETPESSALDAAPSSGFVWSDNSLEIFF